MFDLLFCLARRRSDSRSFRTGFESRDGDAGGGGAERSVVPGVVADQAPAVVTTRRRDVVLAGSGRQVIEVGLYSPREALHYLRQKLPADDGENTREMVALAQDLDCLPLALVQATSFILDRRETVGGYRCRFRDRRRRLEQLFPKDALADDYRSTVAATWAMSVELVGACHQNCRHRVGRHQRRRARGHKLSASREINCLPRGKSSCPLTRVDAGLANRLAGPLRELAS